MSDDELDDIPAIAPKKSKLIPIVLAANTLLLGGVMMFVMKKSGPATAASAAPASAEHGASAESSESAGSGEGSGVPGGAGPTVKLDNFIIQLRTIETESRYVRVGFDLELGAEADKNVLSARMAPVRDSIISYFADRSLEELRGSDGMDQTKAAILKRLETIVPGHRVKAIYITDFVVQ